MGWDQWWCPGNFFPAKRFLVNSQDEGEWSLGVKVVWLLCFPREFPCDRLLPDWVRGYLLQLPMCHHYQDTLSNESDIAGSCCAQIIDDYKFVPLCIVLHH